MRTYKERIEKEVKDSSFYLPVIDILKKAKEPLSIKEIAKLLNITYEAAKPRLHKLKKWNLIDRMKRGYYCLPDFSKDLIRISKPKGELFFINGCIRIMGSSNGVWLTVYNSKFGEINDGKYCIIESFNDDKVVIRKSNKFVGNKIYLLTSKSVGISISRKDINEEILAKLSTKVIPAKIGVYLEEWNTSIKDLFSTESREDGELAGELSKFGIVKKHGKFDDLKADIIFKRGNYDVPIEITTIKPSLDPKIKQKQHMKNSIKSSQILLRFYHSIKWDLLRGLSTILVLHNDWTKYGWIEKEEEFMKRFNCSVIFTDFKDSWAIKVSQEIKRLTESFRMSKTTPLTST